MYLCAVQKIIFASSNITCKKNKATDTELLNVNAFTSTFDQRRYKINSLNCNVSLTLSQALALLVHLL